MNRAKFFNTCCSLCLGSSSVAVLLQACGGVYYAASQVDGNTIIISKTEFIHQKKEELLTRRFVVIQSSFTGFPICLYQINDSEYSALLMKCTHKGCEVRPNDYGLVCPCHGSEYGILGNVTNPPAEKSLTQFKTTTDDTHIYIHLT